MTQKTSENSNLIVHLPDGVDERPGGVDDALGLRRPLLSRNLVTHRGAAGLPVLVLDLLDIRCCWSLATQDLNRKCDFSVIKTAFDFARPSPVTLVWLATVAPSLAAVTAMEMHILESLWEPS